MTTHAHAKPAGTPTWVDLMAPDLDAARSFYHAVFGWEYDIGDPKYGGYTNARVGTRTVTGLGGPEPGAPPMPAAWSTYFATEDIEADVERAVALGAKVISPPMVIDVFGSSAICEDPTGVVFGFWQAGEHIGSEVTDEVGAPAWYELYASNAHQARDFYTALLGATADPMPGDLEYYILKHGETMIAAIMQIDPAWGAFQPQWMTYFGVADADETVATVAKHGGKALSSIDDSPFGRIAALTDPDGATFKIVEIPQT